jgi:hypothetical protein
MDVVTENTLRAIRFGRPEHIPMIFWINPACWHHYEPEVLFDLMDEHRFLFPAFDRDNAAVPELAPWERAGIPYTDAWGCIWETTDDGITGAVTQHPLADWNRLADFVPPDPARTNGMMAIDWAAEKKQAAKAKREGKYGVAGLEHGHAFLRLGYLRGYENLMYDMADAHEKLPRLIEMVEVFSMGIVMRYLELGVAMLCYPEDLGMQNGPMVSPPLFRQYVQPMYEHLVAPAHEAGCLVHMHSDGDIRALVEDILESDVDALNLQDLVNGVDWIATHVKGRVCIDLDIDRQHVTRFGTPEQIDGLIREEVEKLGSRDGGLMMIYGFYPGVPIENARAVMEAMERYAGFYA